MKRNIFYVIHCSISNRPLSSLSAWSLSLPLCVCLSLFVSGRQITRASPALTSLLWVAGVCVEGNFCRHCAGFSDHYQPLWLCLCSWAHSAGELTRCILPLRTARTKTGRRVSLCSCALRTSPPSNSLLLCPLHPQICSSSNKASDGLLLMCEKRGAFLLCWY